jgi:hypothetical protein
MYINLDIIFPPIHDMKLLSELCQLYSTNPQHEISCQNIVGNIPPIHNMNLNVRTQLLIS